ncbi:MAG TPA: hypothetical protein VJ552_13125 [Sediminibacterium sp.]|nr:hypothetical protein [Sediminibacterium sp.]
MTILYPEIHAFLQEVESHFNSIATGRKEELRRFSRYIKQKSENHQPVLLTFICTHNSRRSHFAQIWAQAAAAYYHVQGVVCYSGGTEITAFNPNAVKALQGAGFRITGNANESNPHYKVCFSDQLPPIEAFSKKYPDAPNPQANFGAVLTCDHADESCPIVFGAEERFKIAYSDPKLSDGTPQQEAVYKKRSGQIATEMLYVFSLVNQS